MCQWGQKLLGGHGQVLIMNGRFTLNKAKNHSYLPYNSYLYLFMNEDNAACVYIVKSAGLNLGGITAYDYFGDFLLYDMGNKVLYDLVTGNTLLKDITKAYSAYGYVYVEKGKHSTSYKVYTETDMK